MNRIIILLIFFLPSLKSYAQMEWKVEKTELIMTDPPFKACHASTIVELSSSELMAAFFAGASEGAKDVAIWLTRAKDGRWAKPSIVADGVINDTLRYPCWNPVLFKANDGKLFLFYKVGQNPRQWWGMVKISADNGMTWRKAERLPAGVLGPIKNKPIQLADGTLLSPSSAETDSTWKVQMEKSADGAKTWRVIPVDKESSFKVIQPTILQHKDKRLQILCRSDQDRIITAWSTDKGNSWSSFSKLDLLNPNSGIDAVTLKDGRHLLVYNPTVRGKDWWNNRGKLNVAVSADGSNWKDVAVLENGGGEEYSYPAVIQTEDGKAHITYTYDRKNIKHIILSAASNN